MIYSWLVKESITYVSSTNLTQNMVIFFQFKSRSMSVIIYTLFPRYFSNSHLGDFIIPHGILYFMKNVPIVILEAEIILVLQMRSLDIEMINIMSEATQQWSSRAGTEPNVPKFWNVSPELLPPSLLLPFSHLSLYLSSFCCLMISLFNIYKL